MHISQSIPIKSFPSSISILSKTIYPGRGSYSIVLTGTLSSVDSDTSLILKGYPFVNNWFNEWTYSSTPGKSSWGSGVVFFFFLAVVYNNACKGEYILNSEPGATVTRLFLKQLKS